MMMLLFILALIAGAFVLSLLYTAVVFYIASMIIPHIHGDGFITAFRAAFSFTVWRLILLLPILLVLSIGTFGYTPEMLSRNVVLAYILVLAGDLYALHRAEMSVTELRIDSWLARFCLAATVSGLLTSVTFAL